MEDEIGFVLPPKPDGADAYHSYVCDNIVIIPSCYDAETASNIAFAYNLYTATIPGYDDPDDWMSTYYAHFDDERAVDETIAKFNDGITAHFLTQTLVPEDLGPDLRAHVKLLVLTGMTAGKIRAAAEQVPGFDGTNPEILDVEEFDDAIRAAAARAVSGDVVILSPASTSFDRFRNFEERGNRFQAVVDSL